MRRLAFLALVAAAAPAPATAQVGMGTDIITGVVRSEAGIPLPDVIVEAFSLETEVTRRVVTDARGRFTILFSDGGGQYRMTARTIGYSPRQEIIARQADEDRLVWSVTLVSAPVTLAPVVVRAAPTPVRAPDGPTPGSSERALNAEQMARLPVDATDLALLASLVPGVVPLGGTDSTAAAFSVAGLGPDANALTLDGLLFGTSSIPQDALRQTRVVTSTYDVARGQFSGGLIASTTRSGSNLVQGSSQYQLRDDDLAATEEESAFTQGFTQHVLSGGLGGPVMRDRLFVFASAQARLRSDPQQTLLSAADQDFTRLGIHPDTVARFLSIAEGQGVRPRGVPGADTRSNDNLSGLLRVDYLFSASHTFTLRGDWRGTSQDPARLGPLALPQTGGVIESSGGGGMATLSSRFGTRIINELRAYLQTARSDGNGMSQLPQGRVQVASELPDGATGVSTIVFGGNSGLPTRSRTASFEATDEVSWMPGEGRHRLKLGSLLLVSRSRDLVAGNTLGTFTYNSLAALEANRPASFRRTLESTERESVSRSWALYAGDVWMLSRPLQLTYGLRLEGSAFSNPPAYNAVVDTAFARRTDRLPEEWHLSPRAGFTWTLRPGRPQPGRGPTPPALTVRGGVGEFRSPLPAGLVAQARNATGLDQSASEITCIGPAVPTPDWGLYTTDPGAIPDTCLTEGPQPPSASQRLRTVAVLADGFEAPRAWRGSLAVERPLTPLFRLSVEASFARGIRQYGFRDLNLVPTPRFTLAAEGNRPVYVAPSDIAAATGATRLSGSRVVPEFGQVLEASSNLATEARQLTVGLGGVVGRGILLQASYTWQRARDQATGIRGGSTAGDPNVAEWATSNFERRHTMTLTLTYPFSPSLEVTSVGRLASGSPYTATVGGDVNGDGARNDRAFVFPSGIGTAEAEGMTRLLNQATPSARECLLSQVGRIAGRNSCTGPWQGSLDFQANWRPAVLGLNRRLMVSVVTMNFLRGIDELLHGAAGARGWGLTPRPEGTLLYVTSFDTAGQRFNYQVNERFGATGGTATAFRAPFQIGINMRFTVGPDRARQALDQLRARGGGLGGGGGLGAGGGLGGQGGPGAAFRGAAGSPAEIMSRLETALPNPAALVLERRDSLRLDSSQVSRLEALRDTLAARNTARLDSLRSELEREGSMSDPARLMSTVRPRFEAARADLQRAAEEVRGVLTEDQWARAPERVRAIIRNAPRGRAN